MMVEVRTRDVFAAMRPELDRVESRVEAVSEVDFPVVSSLVLDLVRSGGKRLRPLLLLLAGRAYHYDLDRLVTAAAGVELLHTASLVHDDTIDRSGLRRGKPTLNAVLPAGAVILLGDYLFAQSARLAAATENPRVVAIFASTLADICDGQLREMFFAHRLDQSRDEYEKRIYGKTAALFAGSAEMGALLGGAPEPHVQALRSYGADLGMAFQIVDDVLDLREGTQRLGKPAGNDLRQGTVTLPTMLYAARLSDVDGAAARLRSVVAGEDDGDNGGEMLGQVVAEIRASGVLEEATMAAIAFADQAKRHAEIVPDLETRDMLIDVAEMAWERRA
jgi:geranylgeranyl pyrophosphate synthase